MNTYIASLRRLSLCRVRGRVAWPSIVSIDFNINHRASFSSNRDEGTAADRQKITIQPIHENPIRSNDGTSSGAIVADRLRTARRYAIENMIETFPKKHQKQSSRRGSSPHVVKVGSQPPLQSSVLTNNEKMGVTLNNTNKTMLLSLMSDEELIAELARRRNNNQSSPTSAPPKVVAGKGKELVREHGLIPIGVHTIENPIRSNDGTSSGAIVADRLRMARRKAIENLTTTTTEYNNKPPKE
jgi:hypothetical protein